MDMWQYQQLLVLAHTYICIYIKLPVQDLEMLLILFKGCPITESGNPC